MNSLSINKAAFKKYIKNNFKELKLKVGSWNNITVCPLDSERKRTFFVKIGNSRMLMKVNFSSDEEENSRQKMMNEKTALEFLKRRDLKNIPTLYKFDRHNELFQTETLFMSYISDTHTKLNTNNIYKLANLVLKLHSLESKKFTVPFGDFARRFKGDAYDFINSYVEVLERDIRKIENLYILKRLNFKKFLKGSLLFIKRKIENNKDVFKRRKYFSIIHGHLARNNERKHILIDRNNNFYITDWENVCFGERELEIASFLYENDTISAKIKKYFVDLYNCKKRLNFQKIYIYIYLLKLDDLIEEFKNKRFLIKEKLSPIINKKFLLSLNKEKKILIKLANKIQ